MSRHSATRAGAGPREARALPENADCRPEAVRDPSEEGPTGRWIRLFGLEDGEASSCDTVLPAASSWLCTDDRTRLRADSGRAKDVMDRREGGRVLVVVAVGTAWSDDPLALARRMRESVIPRPRGFVHGVRGASMGVAWEEGSFVRGCRSCLGTNGSLGIWVRCESEAGGSAGTAALARDTFPLLVGEWAWSVVAGSGCSVRLIPRPEPVPSDASKWLASWLLLLLAPVGVVVCVGWPVRSWPLATLPHTRLALGWSSTVPVANDPRGDEAVAPASSCAMRDTETLVGLPALVGGAGGQGEGGPSA